MHCLAYAKRNCLYDVIKFPVRALCVWLMLTLEYSKHLEAMGLELKQKLTIFLTVEQGLAV